MGKWRRRISALLNRHREEIAERLDDLALRRSPAATLLLERPAASDAFFAPMHARHYLLGVS
jgi:hypothetical protein